MKLLFAYLVLMLTMSVSAQNAPTPQCEGSLMVEGKTFALTHVAAFKHDNVEGIYDNAKAVKILLADVDIPPGTLASTFRAAEMVRQGKLHGVMLEVDPAKSGGHSGRILHTFASDTVPTVFFTVLNRDDHRFTNLKLSGDWLSGTVRMTKPAEHSGFKTDDKPITYQYQATFQVRVETPPPVTATLTGAQARNSPQVKAAMEYYAAGKRGDMATLRRLAPPEMLLRFDDMKKQLGEEQAMKQFREFWKQSPAPEAYRKQISKVVVRGNQASVIIKEQGGASWLKLTRQNGVWKLTDD